MNKAIPCPCCEKLISPQVKKCPHCGHTKPQSARAVIGGIIGILVILIIIVSSIDPYNGESVRPSVDAQIKKDFTSIYITNYNRSLWPCADIRVNGILNGYEYKYNKPIPAGETVEIRLSSFTKRNGDRFQPMKTDIKEVIIVVSGYDSPIYEF